MHLMRDDDLLISQRLKQIREIKTMRDEKLTSERESNKEKQ